MNSVLMWILSFPTRLQEAAVDLYKALSPWAYLLIIAVPLVVSTWLALKPFDSVRVRTCSWVLVLTVIFLQVGATRTEIERQEKLDGVLSGISSWIGKNPEEWPEELRDQLQELFGGHSGRFIGIMGSHFRTQEIHRVYVERCAESARDAALAALVEAAKGDATSLCSAALEKSEELLLATEIRVQDSTGEASRRIHLAGNKVIQELEGTTGELRASLGKVTTAVGKVESKVQLLDQSVRGINTDFQEFETSLLAPKSEPSPGMLVSLHDNLGGVDTDVDRLSADEIQTRKYRECLAKRIWPFTRKCASFLPSDQLVARQPDLESQLDPRTAEHPLDPSVDPEKAELLSSSETSEYQRAVEIAEAVPLP